MYKRIAALILSAVVMFGSIGASAENEILLNETFEDYITNDITKAVIAEGDSGVRAVLDGENNKALALPAREQGSSATFKISGTGTEFVISADLKADEALGMEISLLTQSMENVLLTLGDDGCFYTDNGRVAGGIPKSGFVKMAIMINTLTNRYSVVFNKSCAVKDYKYKSALKNPTGFKISTSKTDNAACAYIDNVRVFNGTQLDRSFPQKSFNTQTLPYQEPELKENVNTVYLNDDFSGSLSMPVSKKDNDFSVIKDSDGNSYLKFEKTTQSDIYMDFTRQLSSESIVVQADYCLPKKGGKFNVSMRNPSSVYSTLIECGDDGKMLLYPNGGVCARLSANAWVNIATVVNFKTKTVDLYVDHEIMYKDVPMDNAQTFGNVVSLIRFGIAKGDTTAAIAFDNMKIYDGIEPATEEKTDSNLSESVYENDDVVKYMLRGRIAVQTIIGTIFYDNEKHQMEDLPKMIDGSNYIPVRELAASLGENVLWNDDTKKITVGNKTISPQDNAVKINDKTVVLSQKIIIENGICYLPAKAFATEVLNKFYFEDGRGLIIISDNEVELTNNKFKVYEEDSYENEVEKLNNYLLHPRPTAQELSEKFEKMKNVHPRIIFTSKDFDRVREMWHKDAEMTKRIDASIEEANRRLTGEMAQYIYDGKRLGAQGRIAMYNMELLGFSYQMTHDKKYADRAWVELETVCNFPTWNPTHFLDVAEMSHAVAIGYDWMYDVWTPEQRTVIEKGLLDFGVRPALNEFYGANVSQTPWTQKPNNWNGICCGAAGIAASAIADIYPEECFDALSKGIRGSEYMMNTFYPSGAFCEGAYYMDYALTHEVLYLSTLDSVFGTDFNLSLAPGFSKAPEFLMNMSTNKLGINNYHDAASLYVNSPWVLWFANKFKNQNYSAAFFKREKYYTKQPGYVDYFNSPACVYIPMFWMDTSINADTDIVLPKDEYFPTAEAVGMRDSWNKSTEAYLSFHGGDLYEGHHHGDSGHFIYYALGEKWAVDLGLDWYTYNHDYNQRELVYRCRAEGHNVLVINPDSGLGQELYSFSPVEKFVSKDKGAYSVMNLTEAYGDSVKEARRGYMMGDDRKSLTVRDEFELSKESDVYWFMHTPADVKLTNDGAILTQNGKSVSLKYKVTGADAEMSVMEALPLPTSPNPEGQVSNKGYRKLAIKLRSGGKVSIEIKMIPIGENYPENKLMDMPISQWSIEDGELYPSPRAAAINKDGVLLDEFTPETDSYTIDIPSNYKALPVITLDPGNNLCEKIEDSVNGVKYKLTDPLHPENITVYAVNFNIYDYLDRIEAYSMYDNATITASSEPQPENPMIAVSDRDLKTRWSAKGEQWLMLDLGEIKKVDAVATAWYVGSERNYYFEIQTSEDGINFTKLAGDKSSGTIEGYEIFRTDGINARYIKYVGKNGSTVGEWNSVTELAALVKKQ